MILTTKNQNIMNYTETNAIYRLLSDIAGAIFADNQKRIDEAEVTTAHLRALDFIRKF